MTTFEVDTLEVAHPGGRVGAIGDNLPGPSRRIVVEPIEVPPQPAQDPTDAPAEPADDPVPAR
jgi:hypothetical protein